MAQSSTVEIYLIIAVGIIGMLLLAGFLILFVIIYQKRMLKEQLDRQELERTLQQRILQATLESQEAERRNLAGHLHDSIGGMLSAVRVGLAGMARHLDTPEKMIGPKEMLDETIELVRGMSRELLPPTLEKFGLQAAVRDLAEKFQLTSQIQIAVLQMGSSVTLGSKREVMVFRIAQELLNNAIKHSKATYIEIIFNFQNQLILTVEDNGVGIDPMKFELQDGKGLGLYNVRSRVQLLGATLKLEEKERPGSKIIISIPYDEIKA